MFDSQDLIRIKYFLSWTGHWLFQVRLPLFSLDECKCYIFGSGYNQLLTNHYFLDIHDHLPKKKCEIDASSTAGITLLNNSTISYLSIYQYIIYHNAQLLVLRIQPENCDMWGSNTNSFCICFSLQNKLKTCKY
jgi:hypothetical protein